MTESTNQSDYFFEGAEKLLEIWFQKDDVPDATSLRFIPREQLDVMLEIAKCHILHHRSNEKLDSYVLSESSMFISDRRLIIKTCGNTQLLKILPEILELAKNYAGMSVVSNVYYSRKNFLRPDLQAFPHCSFEHEVEYLSQFFPDGNAFCMGPMNTDRWYLFTASVFDTPPLQVDHTLEIQMTELPSNVLKTFSQVECDTAQICTKKSGISQLVPFGTIIHEELFEPVGYSMNGLVGNTDQYLTLHATPEKEFSYVSFETNERRQCLFKQTIKVLECFKPYKFIITLFSNSESRAGCGTQSRLWNEEIPGYRRLSLQFLRLQSETLIYAQFVRSTRNIPRTIKLENDEDSNNSDN
ncbi:S-adenosylmethionine decarboxylase proenzyme [Aphelenchoides besseyi]|nr:S-adenosylmethionine decarboxylase proenzyme [Aphelenchoides besseyi]KAI6208114.1 S-adenosylmethionine decarboxylase proenzyme [Aphelenchoides besseyi]